MESSNQDNHEELPGELQYDKEHLAALQAAMMVKSYHLLLISSFCFAALSLPTHCRSTIANT